MKKGLLFFALLFAGFQFALAQSMQVSGKVTYADDGQPVAGATIMVEGTQDAVLSKVDGTYKITVPSSSSRVLVATYAGLKAGRANVTSNDQVIDFKLEVEATDIEGVVVTAYGNTTKKAFTGSAAVISDKQIKNLQISSPAQAIQGMAAGVMAVNGSGQPGADPSIRIRGIGSFNGEGAPLLVVDGSIYTGALSTINPADMASMTILKDANSTALYGSRAANGVIMITTKSGLAGKTRINASASVGMSTRAVADYKYLSGDQFLEAGWQAIYNEGFYGRGLTTDAAALRATNDLIREQLYYNPYGDNLSPVGLDGKLLKNMTRAYGDQDWYDALMTVGIRQDYNLSVSGGSDKTRFSFSTGLLDEGGVVRTSKFQRYSARIKVDTEITKWLKAGLSANFNFSKDNSPNQSGAAYVNSMGFVRSMPSIYPAYMLEKDGTPVLDGFGNMIPDYGTGSHPGMQTVTNPDGTQKKYDRPIAARMNPVGTTTLDKNEGERLFLSTIAFMEATFLKHFKVRTQAAIDYNDNKSLAFQNPYYGDGVSWRGRGTRTNSTTSNINWTNTLTYDQTFGKKHHVNALVGMESSDYFYKTLSAVKTGYDLGGSTEFDYASTLSSISSGSTGSRNMRYIARAQYDFDDRLHFSASYTYDGTSRFKGANKWGSFYSVGASWNISNEKWFAPARDVLSDLKVRASYGTTGNANIGLFPYMSTYAGGITIGDNYGAYVAAIGNTDLRWEKQAQFDVGFEASFLKGAINLGVGYYNRRSDDLLMSRPLPPSTGTGSIKDNIGMIENSGIEIEFSANIFSRKNVQWSVGFNLTNQQSKVITLPENTRETNGMASPSSTLQWLREGYNINSWYLREFAGVDAAKGNPLWYKDITAADGKVIGRETTSKYSEATRYLAGSSVPTWFGGINTNLNIYGVEIGIIGSFALGGKVYDGDKAGLMNSNVLKSQTSIDVLNAWKKPGDITNIPMLNAGVDNQFTSSSDRWLVDGSYFRIRNITVAYDFTRIKGVKALGLNALRLYCSMDNMFTFFGSEGLDPEQTLTAITNSRSSAMKTVSFGINIGF